MAIFITKSIDSENNYHHSPIEGINKNDYCLNLTKNNLKETIQVICKNK